MFKDVIRKSGRSQKLWAEDIGVSKSYLSDLLNGKAMPSLTVAARIERLTGGQVPASSWVSETDAA